MITKRTPATLINRHSEIRKLRQGVHEDQRRYGMFRRQQLRLTRIDVFQDLFEGAVADVEIDNQVVLSSGASIRGTRQRA